MPSKKTIEWLPETAPTPFDGAGFKELWQTLLKMSKWKKKPLSAIEMACKRLKRFDECFASQLVENAIEGNYQGVVFTDSQMKFEQYKRNLNGAKNFGNIKDKPIATTQPKGGFGQLQ
jgi:hypothetical protein